MIEVLYCVVCVCVVDYCVGGCVLVGDECLGVGMV